MFTGQSVHQIDSKGRVSIPAAMRTEMLRRSERTPMLMRSGDHLKLYPYEVWEEQAERLGSLTFPQPRVEAFRRYIATGTVPCPFDAQGRILIPPRLREKAGLAKEVVIAGVLTHIEIWNRERFEKAEDRAEAQLLEDQGEVAKLDLRRG